MNSTIHADNKDNKPYISTYVLALFIILLPVSTALSGIVGNISFSNYVALLYVGISIVEVLYNRYFVINKKILPILLYMGYTTITCFWSKGLKFDFYLTTFLLSFAILLLATCRRYSKGDFQIVLKAFLIGSLVVLSVTLLNLNNTYAGRIVIEITSVMDPNDFGCGTCLILSSLLIYYTKSKRVFSLLLLVGVIGAVLLTGSRGALLMCVVELMVFVSLFLKRSKLKVAVLCLLMVVAFLIFYSELSTELLTRFSLQTIIQSGGSGRREIWEAGILKFIHSDPLHMIFGYGHGSFADAVGYYGGTRTYAYEAHNVFINALIESGLTGLSLLVLSFYTAIKVAKANKNYIGYIGIIGFLVTGLTLDVQSYRIFPIAFITAMLIGNNMFLKYLQ